MLWRPVIRRMTVRDPLEAHRQASFLELFFDLCFVVAIANVASEWHHAVLDGHWREALSAYLTLFFGIWWAWMNFTWVASAYDNDDTFFRWAAFSQIVGSLILAAGIQRAFESANFDAIFIGYAVMRAGLIALWIRAALDNPERRITAFRYAIGLGLVMIGWTGMFITGKWPLWLWWTLATVELLIPAFAEYAGRTQWHPHHIAERYGLMTIIVLGESVLAASGAVQKLLDTEGALRSAGSDIAGGLLILFSMWWIYFDRPGYKALKSTRQAFLWGYGHYFIYCSGAAVGAGMAIYTDVLGDPHHPITVSQAVLSITIPVVVYVVMTLLLHLRHHVQLLPALLTVLAGSALMIVVSFSSQPVLLAGLVMMAITVVLQMLYRECAPGPASAEADIPQ